MKKKNLKIATGRVGVPELLSIEEMEARAAFARFGTDNRDEYEQHIDSMTTFDLSNHAVSVGLRPVSERSRVRAALLTAFEHAKASVRNVPKVGSSLEAITVNERLEDNYENFIKQFRPVGA